MATWLILQVPQSTRPNKSFIKSEPLEMYILVSTPRGLSWATQARRRWTGYERRRSLDTKARRLSTRWSRRLQRKRKSVSTAANTTCRARLGYPGWSWTRCCLTLHSQDWSISRFSCSPTGNITSCSMKNLAFHSLFRRWLYDQFSPPHLYISL